MSYSHDNQVGGTHYNQGDKPQHWDLVLMYDWDYFQAQVVKYLMRWKTKFDTPEKRLEDLKKARSFLDKYITAQEAKVPIVEGKLKVPSELDVAKKFPPLFNVAAYSDDVFSCEGYYGDGTNLFQHRESRITYRCKTLQQAHDFHKVWVERMSGAEPSGAYVNQG